MPTTTDRQLIVSTFATLDEIRTWVHPVVRGRGEPIFAGWPETRWRLAWWSSLPKGVMILAHRPESS
ncbi:hypothetical protein [Dactylosporangium fulvum]|uniref:Uncharacterized protein n=1 Tax=Dactylosporangium fulvum TaxID=53359 RepID=A0ABY5VRC4_9ACTN|nr:hypothetical protein [Dactylosporangium fulvum]UWP79737.1 hypothetical protein Dfulv_31840 [Dactylosporangium fulvum]